MFAQEIPRRARHIDLVVLLALLVTVAACRSWAGAAESDAIARGSTGQETTATLGPATSDPWTAAVRVERARALGTDHLKAQRIPLGEADDYKPSLVRLASGELMIVAFHQHRLPNAKVREDMLRFRSRDGGRTWSPGQTLPLLGREPYFSQLRDGTLFITTHLLQQDIRNTFGLTVSYLHRSADGGQTWDSLAITAADLPGADPKAWIVTSRNVLELVDGTALFGVSAPGGIDYLWRTSDGGKTWDRTLACQFAGVDKSKLWWPFMAETYFWQTRDGDLLGLWRVDHWVFPFPDRPAPVQQEDQYERLIVFRSRDGGRAWQRDPELGSDYAEMYPALLRLADGRLLLTFTVRALRPPLGVQAVLGEETPSGFRFDFGADRLILDEKTPAAEPSGGGFGPTVQLADGTLVATYSYRGADHQTYLEVVRFRLPGAPADGS